VGRERFEPYMVFRRWSISMYVKSRSSGFPASGARPELGRAP
jgi:hypothetical protein